MRFWTKMLPTGMRNLPQRTDGRSHQKLMDLNDFSSEEILDYIIDICQTLKNSRHRIYTKRRPPKSHGTYIWRATTVNTSRRSF